MAHFRNFRKPGTFSWSYGEHTRQVLAEVGLGENEIDDLVEGGVVQ